MSSNFRDVGKFCKKFDLPRSHYDYKEDRMAEPRELTDEEYDFRVDLMQEELDEYVEATQSNDLPSMADGLIDLVYVAMGTAHLHQFDWDQLWTTVQRANMTKMRAISKDQSKRGSTFDVVKPEGWTPPDIRGVLRRQGWKG